MHRALPGGALLLVLLLATALSGGCVALYTISEVADPPPHAPGGDARAGLPLFPPGIPVSEPAPAPSVTPGPERGGDGEPFVPAPSTSVPVVEPQPPSTWSPTGPITAAPSEPPSTWSPTGPITVPPSEAPSTWSPTAPITAPPSASNQTLAVDDGLPGRDEVYHPIVTPLPPV